MTPHGSSDDSQSPARQPRPTTINFPPPPPGRNPTSYRTSLTLIPLALVFPYCVSALYRTDHSCCFAKHTGFNKDPRLHLMFISPPDQSKSVYTERSFNTVNLYHFSIIESLSVCNNRKDMYIKGKSRVIIVALFSKDFYRV